MGYSIIYGYQWDIPSYMVINGIYKYTYPMGYKASFDTERLDLVCWLAMSEHFYNTCFCQSCTRPFQQSNAAMAQALWRKHCRTSPLSLKDSGQDVVLNCGFKCAPLLRTSHSHVSRSQIVCTPRC